MGDINIKEELFEIQALLLSILGTIKKLDVDKNLEKKIETQTDDLVAKISNIRKNI